MTLKELLALVEAAKLKAANFEASIKDANGVARGMTKEELAQYRGLLEDVKTLKEQAKLKEEQDRDAAEDIRNAPADSAQRTVPAVPKGDDKKFKTFGEQLVNIAQAGMNKNVQVDPRLVWGKAAGANETVPSEGGFLVQEDFSTKLLSLSHEMGEIINRVTNIPISSNSNALKLPTIDETSRARGSRWGGVRAYWLAEGEQKVDSKPKFGEISLALNKLAALGYATDELLQDSNALERIMLQAFAEEIRFEVEDSIINGNGVGKPLGIMNSGAVITIAEESSQANATINFQNLVKMMERLPIRSRRNAVWLVGEGVETALFNVTLPGGAGFPIFLPQGQNAATQGNAVLGTLLGRPVIPVEYLPTLGSAGDIMLVDLTEYLTIDKGGIQSAESMHVRFIYDEMCFRMVYRIDGQPAWRTPVTSANGAFTKSPFIALGARS